MKKIQNAINCSFKRNKEASWIKYNEIETLVFLI